LTEHTVTFVPRARGGVVAYQVPQVPQVPQVLVETPVVRDRIVRLGQRKHPCRHPVRLIEVQVGSEWHGYLTNELDPARLPTACVVDLYSHYSHRWRGEEPIEEAFLLVKRLLGLAYVGTGAANGIALQVGATWLLYAVLIDLSDALAEELNLPLDRISVEMVFRGLYFFCGAYQCGAYQWGAYQCGAYQLWGVPVWGVPVWGVPARRSPRPRDLLGGTNRPGHREAPPQIP
jgi:hypothetical protein